MDIYTGSEDVTIARREGRKVLVRSALIILAVAILATAPGWFPGLVYAGAGPRAAMSRIAVEYAAQRLKAGEIPLWNPNVGLGAPVVGNGRTGVFYPTILLHMTMPAKAAWVANAIVLMSVAGFGVVVLMVAFAQRTGLHGEPYAGALPAGLMFMAIAMCIRFLDLSAMNALALLPWALLASGALLNRMSAARLVGLTLLFVMVFLGGDDAASLGVTLTCIIYPVWSFIRRPSQWTAFVGALLALIAAIAVAASVAAVQWMPAMNGSEARSILFVLAPIVALGLALSYGWIVRRSAGIARKLLVWVGPIGPLVIVIMFSTTPEPRQEHLEAVRWIAQQNPGAHLRVLAQGVHAWQVPGNALATAPGQPQRVRQWLEGMERIEKNELSLERVEHPALRLLGAKYLIADYPQMYGFYREASATAPATTQRTPVGMAAGAAKMDWMPVWPPTSPQDWVVVFENLAQPLPRFWIARNAQWSDKAQEVFDRLAKLPEQLDFDPHEVVLLDREDVGESESGMLRRLPLLRGAGRLELLEDSPERVRIATQGAGGWLVVADAYAPGWKAKMSYTVVSRGPRRGSSRDRSYERELPIVPAYGAMRAVALAGGAEVVFEYEPKGWKNGLMVAAIGGIVLLILVGGMMFPSGKDRGAIVARDLGE